MKTRFRNRGVLIFGELAAFVTAVAATFMGFLAGEITTGILGLATAIGAMSLLVHAWRNTILDFVRYASEEEVIAAAKDDGKIRWWPEK